MGRRANVLELSENLTQKEISDYKKKLISNIREHMKSWQNVFTLRRCLEDGQELDDVEDLVREICSFVMGIRDEIPQDIDYSLPKLPF